MDNRSGGKPTFIFWSAVTVILSLSCNILSGADPTPTNVPSPVVEAEATAGSTGTGSTALESQTPVPSPTPFMPYYEPAECPFVIPSEAEVDCGFIIVTEDRDGDLADTIRLAVAVYHSTADAASDVPAFYLQGGPGSPAVDWSAGFYYNRHYRE
jgi:hypothetical protein